MGQCKTGRRAHSGALRCEGNIDVAGGVIFLLLPARWPLPMLRPVRPAGFLLTFCCASLLFLSAAPRTYADPTQLTAEEVEIIVAQAATHASREHRSAIIAVTDREGFLLALWDMGGQLPNQLPAFDLSKPVLKIYGLAGGAITRASTAAFLSSDQNAFTSRTAGYIIQQHFPVGVRNTPPGPLVGVGLSSLFFSDVNRVKLIPPGFSGSQRTISTVSPGARSSAFPLSSLNDSPGGVPLYKDGHLVGGIGVTGDGSPTDLAPAAAIFFRETQRDATPGFKTGRDADEDVALAGQTHFRPRGQIVASNVLLNGIRIPYVHPRLEDIEDVRDVQPLGSGGTPVSIPGSFDQAPFTGGAASAPVAFVQSGVPQGAPAGFPYPSARFGGVGGEIRFPLRDDPLSTTPGREKIGDASRLTAADVEDILSAAAERCARTRAGIRLPIGTSAKTFIVVVNNPNKNGEAPAILGIFRVGEATIFSWDVAAQKARTAVFFSNRQLATSSRSVGFLAQRFFPPGLDGRPHGPFFGFQEAVSLRQRPIADQKRGAGPFPGNPNLPNGITIFPGGFPLYRHGALVGAIGVSGDGVDQDDLIAASGCRDFLPPKHISADNYTYRSARLPYAKFPRDPEQ